MVDIPYPTTPVPLDTSGRIDADLPCLGCGYNLRGLNPDGVCPECATPVGRSQYGNLLRYSNPDWVDQLASGMNWLVASIVFGILAGIVAAVLGGFLGGAAGATVATGVVQIGASLVSLIAYWKVTAPDPSQTESTLTARQLVRALTAAQFVLGLAAQGAQHLDHRLALFLSEGSGLIDIAQSSATFVYARQLAMRIPDLQLADRTRLVMWGVVISYGLIAIMSAIELLSVSAAGGAGGAAGMGLSVFGCAGGVGILIFGLWSLLLIDRYRKAFGEAARKARMTWASDTETVPRAM